MSPHVCFFFIHYYALPTQRTHNSGGVHKKTTRSAILTSESLVISCCFLGLTCFLKACVIFWLPIGSNLGHSREAASAHSTIHRSWSLKICKCFTLRELPQSQTDRISSHTRINEKPQAKKLTGEVLGTEYRDTRGRCDFCTLEGE